MDKTTSQSINPVQEPKKMSALDLIKSNFDFVQNQYQEDYEKQDLIGYEDAIRYIDLFVKRQNTTKSFEQIQKEHEEAAKGPPKLGLGEQAASN